MSPKKKFWLFLAVLVAVSLLFVLFPPTQIVGRLGVQNSLLIAFLVSLLGGVSTVTSASFFAVIGGLAIGGVPIGIMMLVCGPALLVGDLVFYAFGQSSHHIVPKKIQPWLEKFRKKMDAQKEILVQGVVIVYTGFTPFPGDVLMFALAFLGYPFRRMVAPLLLGNMLLVWSIANVALGGTSLWDKIF